MTKVKAITAKQAKAIGEKTGFPITSENGRTFYATTEDPFDYFRFVFGSDKKLDKPELETLWNNGYFKEEE